MSFCHFHTTVWYRLVCVLTFMNHFWTHLGDPCQSSPSLHSWRSQSVRVEWRWAHPWSSRSTAAAGRRWAAPAATLSPPHTASENTNTNNNEPCNSLFKKSSKYSLVKYIVIIVEKLNLNLARELLKFSHLGEIIKKIDPRWKMNLYYSLNLKRLKLVTKKSLNTEMSKTLAKRKAKNHCYKNGFKLQKANNEFKYSNKLFEI